MLRGYDVSKVQGVVDWEAERARGIDFAFIECTVGNDSVDRFFKKNSADTKAAGIVRGPYHFCYPLPPKAGIANHDPKGQMQLFFSACEDLGAADGDLPPMLDLEWPPPQDFAKWGCSWTQVRDWALAAADEVSSLFGVAPIFYIYPWWWEQLAEKADVSDFAKYLLCIADYEDDAKSAWPDDGYSPPKLPFPWKPDWAFSQTTGGTGKNRVLLANGAPVDSEIFNGTIDDLMALTKRGTGT